MFKRRALAALLLTAGAVTVTGQAAIAEPPAYNYLGWSGGTLVRAIGTTITSDLTAMSAVSGSSVPAGSSTNVANLRVGGMTNWLARANTVNTSESVFAFEDGVRLVSHAKTLGVSLLGGKIKADAVETTTVTTASPTKGMSTEAATTFVNLSIGGKPISPNVQKNFMISLGGLATIVLNGQETKTEPGLITTHGYGAKITLLSAFSGAQANSVIVLNPTFAGMSEPVPVDVNPVGGHAFATRVHTDASSSIQLDSGQSAAVYTPAAGTGDQEQSNTTARVKFQTVLNAGAAASVTKALTIPGFAEVTNTNEIAGVNLLNGAITATGIKVKAHSKGQNGTWKQDMKLTFVKLTVGSSEIPLDVGPNTAIKLGDLATVIINRQQVQGFGNAITAIYVKLLKPFGQTPAGAIIEVGKAVTFMSPAAVNS